MKANSPIAAISDETLRAVCKIGQGAETCRYVTCGARGFECEKHGELRGLLDARVESGQMKARGDNCDGIKPGFAP